MHSVRVNENNLISRNVFVVNHFPLGDEKESIYHKRTFLWGSQRSLDPSLNP